VDKLLYRVYAQRYKLADADICWFVLCSSAYESKVLKLSSMDLQWDIVICFAFAGHTFLSTS